MKLKALALAALLIGACSSPPPQDPPQRVHEDDAYAGAVHVPTEDELHAMGLNKPLESTPFALWHDSGCTDRVSTWPTDPTLLQAIDDAAELVNRIRVSFGFPCASESPQNSIASWDHAKYNVKQRNLESGGNFSCSGSSNHVEVSGCQEFTGVQFTDRLTQAGQTWPGKGEVMAYDTYGSSMAQTAIDAWMKSAYHQLPPLQCKWNILGFGAAQFTWLGLPLFSAEVMDYASSWGASTPCASDGPSHWPHSGTVGVNRSWDGNEDPHPPISYPSGPVFTFKYPHVVMTDAHLVDKSTGLWVTTARYYSNTDPAGILAADEALMVPTSPLKANTTYEPHFNGTMGGNPIDFWWQIQTGN